MRQRPPRSTLFPYTTLFRSPMRRIRVAETSRATLDGAPMVLWREAAVVAPVEAAADLPLTWIGAAGADSIARDRKSTRLNSSHVNISYAVFWLQKQNNSLMV